MEFLNVSGKSMPLGQVNKLAKVTASRVYRPIAFGRAFIWEMGDQSLSHTPCWGIPFTPTTLVFSTRSMTWFSGSLLNFWTRNYGGTWPPSASEKASPSIRVSTWRRFSRKGSLVPQRRFGCAADAGWLWWLWWLGGQGVEHMTLKRFRSWACEPFEDDKRPNPLQKPVCNLGCSDTEGITVFWSFFVFHGFHEKPRQKNCFHDDLPKQIIAIFSPNLLEPRRSGSDSPWPCPVGPVWGGPRKCHSSSAELRTTSSWNQALWRRKSLCTRWRWHLQHEHVKHAMTAFFSGRCFLIFTSDWWLSWGEWSQIFVGGYQWLVDEGCGGRHMDGRTQRRAGMQCQKKALMQSLGHWYLNLLNSWDFWAK